MNRSFFRTALVAAALASLSVGAIAADSFIVGGEQITHVTETGKRWEGAYVGVVGGNSIGTIQDVANPKAASRDTNGVFGGVVAGHNWQLDNGVVFGIEGDVIAGGPKSEWAGNTTNQYDSYYGSDVVNGSASVRARLGYNINDTLLPYVTAGVVGAHTTNTLGCDRSRVVATNGCKTQFEDSSSQFVFGYTVGAGVELAVSDTVAVRTEYRYTKFNDNGVTLTDPNYPALSGRNFASDSHAIMAGFTVKF